MKTISQQQVPVQDYRFGGEGIVIIGGPCAVESEDQIHHIARAVAAAGGHVLRGGAFKSRTHPGAFQGLGLPGLHMLRRAADAHGLLVVSEVTDTAQLQSAADLLDIIQVGARHMHNTALLQALGPMDVPVLLKRGFGATIDEWCGAVEYIMEGGNRKVILCERGIRSFETATRFTLDLAAVPVMKQRTGLPVIVDPSHAAGQRDLVAPLALAAIAAGADGLMMETQCHPEEALSDGAQTVTCEDFADIVKRVGTVAEALGRWLAE